MSDYGKEETTLCTKCNKFIETALMLQCDHNLCLPCACVNFLKEEQRYSNLTLSNKYHSVKCEVCSQLTSIDSETAEHLLLYKPEETSRVYSAHHSPKGVIKVIVHVIS
jgi:hypothetical protein